MSIKTQNKLAEFPLLTENSAKTTIIILTSLLLRKPGEYNLTFAKKSAQGREFKVYKEREGKKRKEKMERKEKGGERKRKRGKKEKIIEKEGKRK